MESIRYCENCGKELTTLYATRRFCSKKCACIFAGKKSYEKSIQNKEVFFKNLEKARSRRDFQHKKEDKPANCVFCGKLCKNGNSLRNHERLCSKNPNRQLSAFADREKMSKINRKKLLDSTRGEFCCSFCGKIWQTSKSGFKTHEKHCISNPNRIPGSWTGREHTEEQKRKISEASKKAHDEGRGHTWQNRHLNPSYAEQWLYGVLEKRNIKFEKEKPFKGFFLDVVIGNKVIEIDGEQHYDKEKFPEQHEADIRKDTLLKEEGYLELRLRWADVKRAPEFFVEQILNFINDGRTSFEGKFKSKQQILEEKEEDRKIKLLKKEQKQKENLSLIKNCEINFTKKDWKSKASKTTGLSVREINKIVSLYPEEFVGIYVDKRDLKGNKNNMFGKHWYTNGVDNIVSTDCPEGYYLGRTEIKNK